MTGSHGQELFKVDSSKKHGRLFLPEPMVLHADEYARQKREQQQPASSLIYNPAPDLSQITNGTLVEVRSFNGHPLYGTVKWLGTLPGYEGIYAGVELVSY